TIISWMSPLTSRFLFEAAGAYLLNRVDVEPTDGRWLAQRSVLDQSTGYRYGSQFLAGPSLDYHEGNNYSHFSTRASASYITRSHSMKVGASTLSGLLSQGSVPLNDVGYVFSNRVPIQLQEFASPQLIKARVTKFGLYGQDQWTKNRLTINLGVRFDHLNEF